MNPASAALRASRPLFRTQQFTIRNPFQRPDAFRTGSRRFQGTTTNEVAVQESFFKRMWDSPVGFKTVHFWAPVMKWALVLAGIADLARPAEKLSLTQNGALTATGLIWTRWCFVIRPQNYLLAAVNFFLAIVGITQVTRIASYRASNNKSSVTEIKEEVIEVNEV